MRVFCYYNLHRHCFSMRALEGASKGRVIAHAAAVHIANATFKVSAAGRARVLSSRQKNVHAGVSGELLGWRALDAEGAPDGQESDGDAWPELQQRFESEGVSVTYDPYKYEHFTQVVSKSPLHQSAECLLSGKRVWAKLPAGK